MNMNIEDEHKRSLIFLGRKTLIHVSRSNGLFHNGILIEVGSDFFILKDRIGGKEEFIFFTELTKPLQPCKEIGE